MITDMHVWTKVRLAVLRDGMSKREACRKFDLNFRTVQKIIQNEEPPGYRATQPRSKWKLGPFVEIIHGILEADKKVHHKQRHTGKRIFERLRDEYGYTGGLTIVRDEVRLWKSAQKEVFVPLTHPPGEAQFDFGEARAVYRGRPIKIAFVEVTLPYSGAVYCQAFPAECTETFQAGHVRAFAFFGGVPTRISYDNSRIAVAKFVGGRGDTPTREFLRLESHYLFDHHFCRIRRGNEKGSVENAVGFCRRNFMVPVPQFDDFETFNQYLEDRCRQDQARTLRGRNATKGKRLDEERKTMRPLPKRAFEARRVEPTRANSLSLVRFHRNDYSVPTRYAHRRITAVGSIDRVRLIVEDRVVAEHIRDWGRENVHYDPIHYLALLERKPGAWDYAEPLKDWKLPQSFETLRRRLESESEGDGRREFIRILRLLESWSLSELDHAVIRALHMRTLTRDAIRLLLQSAREVPVPLLRLDKHPHLRKHHFDEPPIRSYSDLLQHEEPQQ